MKKETSYEWKSQHQEAFEYLKKRLVTIPILVHTDFNKPFTIMTDASALGLGTVLLQKDDNEGYDQQDAGRAAASCRRCRNAMRGRGRDRRCDGARPPHRAAPAGRLSRAILAGRIRPLILAEPANCFARSRRNRER